MFYKGGGLLKSNKLSTCLYMPPMGHVRGGAKGGGRLLPQVFRNYLT